MKKYNIDFLQYGTTQFVKSDCNTITFYNAGTSILLINQVLPLANGQSFTITGNENELCTTQFLLTFEGEGINNCVIARKTYIS